MTLNERKTASAWDLWFGSGITAAFVSCFVLNVLVGPELVLMLSGCMMYPLLAAAALVIAYRLVVCTPRFRRALLLASVFGCLATALVVPPGDIVDLHVLVRVYRAGGPRALSDWAQELMREQAGMSESRSIEPEQMPENVRKHLCGTVCIYQERVRIELGGGFFHYGLLVFPTGTEVETEPWQRILGWPPEVVIYHED